MKRLGFIFLMIFSVLILVSCKPEEINNDTYYKVEFDTLGGSEVSSLEVLEGELVEKPEDPTKEGYDFVGWYLDKDSLLNQWSFKNDLINENITLYAKWILEGTMYKVTYELNNDQEEIVEFVSPNKTLIKPDITYKEHVLIGWYLDVDLFEGLWNFEEDLVNEDITLYAKWGKKEKVKTKFIDGFRGQLDDHKDVNNANTIGMEPNYFNVKSIKGSTNNNVGIYDEFRFYAGTTLIIEAHESFLIDGIRLSNNANNFTIKSNNIATNNYSKDLKSSEIKIINHTNARQDINYLEITYYQVGPDVIKEDDINRPEIDISENQLIELEIGDTFNIPTLTAYDVEDGDVDVIYESDNVDIHNYGIYYAFYYAIDSDDNRTDAYITIIVREVNGIENYYSNVDFNKEKTDLWEDLNLLLNQTLTLQRYDVGNTAIGIMDRDPNNFNNVWLIYNSASIRGDWTGGMNWAKEHTWAKSAFGTDSKGFNHSISKTPNNYIGIGTDLHNLRAINPSVNTTHSNLEFGGRTEDGKQGLVSVEARPRNPYTPGKENEMTTNIYYPGDEHIGDVARILLYMNVTWDLLFREDIEMLLEWHLLDPVDNFEKIRNEVIYTYQGNRNPFIDYPELAKQIYVN